MKTFEEKSGTNDKGILLHPTRKRTKQASYPSI
jgi:hypothetical protein